VNAAQGGGGDEVRQLWSSVSDGRRRRCALNVSGCPAHHLRWYRTQPVPEIRHRFAVDTTTRLPANNDLREVENGMPSTATARAYQPFATPPARSLPRRPGCPCRGCIRSGTGDGNWGRTASCAPWAHSGHTWAQNQRITANYRLCYSAGHSRFGALTWAMRRVRVPSPALKLSVYRVQFRVVSRVVWRWSRPSPSWTFTPVNS
jgi:hypothetical protein